jgi:type II secretory pathway pseudopilin PulG
LEKPNTSIFAFGIAMNIQAQKQRGFGLIETLFAIILIMAITMSVFSQQLSEARDDSVKATGKGLTSVAYSLNDVLGEFYGKWISATPGSPLTFTLSDGTTEISIADSSRPTIAELLPTGYFPQNFTGTAGNGGKYVFSIKKVPAGCVSPSCNLEALVCIDRPILKDGGVGVDSPRLGLAVTAIGQDGGAATIDSPAQISGKNGSWSAANDVVSPSNRAGILCMRAGYASSAWSAFFRIDGTRWMRADANMGGNSIVNAKQLVTILKPLDSACTDPGAIAAGRDTKNSEVSMVCRNGKWSANTGVTGIAGEPCTPEGSDATVISTGEKLFCKHGIYVRMQSLLGTQIVQKVNVIDGQRVPKPACDAGGLPDYTLVMNKATVDVTKIPPYQSSYVSTQDAGSDWLVIIRVRNDSSGELSGNTYAMSALMVLECKY